VNSEQMEKDLSQRRKGAKLLFGDSPKYVVAPSLLFNYSIFTKSPLPAAQARFYLTCPHVFWGNGVPVVRWFRRQHRVVFGSAGHRESFWNSGP